MFYGQNVVCWLEGECGMKKREYLLQLVLLLVCLLLSGSTLLQQSVPVEATEEAPRIYITVRHREDIFQMELEEYIRRVVLAEMPAYFEPDALKAQAVAARTFACRAVTTGGKHGDGSICTAFSCCQGYLEPGQYLQSYGNPSDLEKITAAVQTTAGIIVTYRGAPIEAAFFSSASGLTEDAAAVWGGARPYLIAQESPEADTQQQVVFSRAYLEKTLGVSLVGAEPWFADWTYTPGQGVDSVKIGSRVFTGTQLRQLLGLRSTAFTVAIENDAAVFTVHGYGHRVGMSQYGADAMAAQGSTFREILAYYYPGTELTEITNFSEN